MQAYILYIRFNRHTVAPVIGIRVPECCSEHLLSPRASAGCDRPGPPRTLSGTSWAHRPSRSAACANVVAQTLAQSARSVTGSRCDSEQRGSDPPTHRSVVTDSNSSAAASERTDTTFLSGKAAWKTGEGEKLTSGSPGTSVSCNCAPARAAWRTPPDTGAASCCHRAPGKDRKPACDSVLGQPPGCGDPAVRSEVKAKARRETRVAARGAAPRCLRAELGPALPRPLQATARGPAPACSTPTPAGWRPRQLPALAWLVLSRRGFHPGRRPSPLPPPPRLALRVRNTSGCHVSPCPAWHRRLSPRQS